MNITLPLWLSLLVVGALGYFIGLSTSQRTTIRALKTTVQKLESDLQDRSSDLITMISSYWHMRSLAKGHKATADVLTAVCGRIAQRLPEALKHLKTILDPIEKSVTPEAELNAQKDDLCNVNSNGPAANDAFCAANDEAA